MIAVLIGGPDNQRVTILSQNNTVDWGSFTDSAHIPVKEYSEKLWEIGPSNYCYLSTVLSKTECYDHVGIKTHTVCFVSQLWQTLVPDLLEFWMVVIDIHHLDDDSGAGLHSSHAQGTHHQKVRCYQLL